MSKLTAPLTPQQRERVINILHKAVLHPATAIQNLSDETLIEWLELLKEGYEE